MSTAVTILLQILALVQAGVDIATAAGPLYAKLKAIQDEGRDPTDQEWADLNAEIDRLRGELHAPD